MFETPVEIHEEYIKVGKKEIPYSDVVGINYSTDFLRHIAPHFPSATLYLKSGHSLRINNQQHKFIDTPFCQFGDSDRFARLKEILDEKCRVSDKFSPWLPWRIIAPVAVVQPILFGILMMQGYQFELAHTTTLITSIVFLIPGFIWDRRAKKAKYSMRYE